MKRRNGWNKTIAVKTWEAMGAAKTIRTNRSATGTSDLYSGTILTSSTAGTVPHVSLVTMTSAACQS